METANNKYYFSTYLKSSYRTYEEWKPDGTKITFALDDSSYRTYEEWKQISTPDASYSG